MDAEEEWLMDRNDGGSLSRFEGGFSREGRRKKKEGGNGGFFGLCLNDGDF